MDTMDFQKTSGKDIPGKKKAAILFGELGRPEDGVAESVMEYLNADEKKKLLKAMKKLGTRYNPYDKAQVQDEIQVLEDLEKFGKRRNIYRDVAGERKAFQKVASSPAAKIKEALSNNPDGIANVLSAWLKKDD